MTALGISARDGILINFGDGANGSFRFFLPASVAKGVILAIHAAGKSGDWWDNDYVLKPLPH